MTLPPFKLERYFARYEFSAPYLLCSSDCEARSVAELLALEPDAAARFERCWLGYTESLGAPTLREEISRLYTTIRPEEVLVFSGAEEAIFWFMHAALQPGDHVIVHSPGYQSLSELPLSLGCDVTPWLAREENGWALDLDQLEASLRPTTRAVILNTPHNPTGYLMSAADFARLNRLTQARGVLLFCDEVYRGLEYQEAERLPAGCDLNPLAVSLGVLSKTYGLAGLRIGWIATHQRELYQRMLTLKDYTTICNSAPSEFLAELALRHGPALAGRNLAIIAHNLALLDDFFLRHAARLAWARPRAGSVAFPRLLQGEIEAFCHDLVTQQGVMLLPGTVFDGSNHFRLGFGRKNMPEALNRLDAFLGQAGG